MRMGSPLQKLPTKKLRQSKKACCVTEWNCTKSQVTCMSPSQGGEEANVKPSIHDVMHDSAATQRFCFFSLFVQRDRAAKGTENAVLLLFHSLARGSVPALVCKKERNDYQMIAILTHNLAPRSEKKEKKKTKEKEKKKGTHVSKPYTRTFQSTVAGALNAQVSTVLTSVPKSYWTLIDSVPYFHSITSYNIKQGNIKSSPKHRLPACMHRNQKAKTKPSPTISHVLPLIPSNLFPFKHARLVQTSVSPTATPLTKQLRPLSSLHSPPNPPLKGEYCKLSLIFPPHS